MFESDHGEETGSRILTVGVEALDAEGEGRREVFEDGREEVLGDADDGSTLRCPGPRDPVVEGSCSVRSSPFPKLDEMPVPPGPRD
ncbi:hypothetical protein [Candidatus Palauibacter sp.]|uniref:hypothetical protein n=1 Tax=Candidatus Palauibacter sp. TaxID=3101350 RepID=UPI003B5A3A08